MAARGERGLYHEGIEVKYWKTDGAAYSLTIRHEVGALQHKCAADVWLIIDRGSSLCGERLRHRWSDISKVCNPSSACAAPKDLRRA
jgi:hypothetical protein